MAMAAVIEFQLVGYGSGQLSQYADPVYVCEGPPVAARAAGYFGNSLREP